MLDYISNYYIILTSFDKLEHCETELKKFCLFNYKHYAWALKVLKRSH